MVMMIVISTGSSVGSVDVIGSMTSSKQRRSLFSESLTGTGSATSYVTYSAYQGSASCDGSNVQTYSEFGGFCVYETLLMYYFMVSYSSDDNNVIITTNYYADNKCTTPSTNILLGPGPVSVQKPKTCKDISVSGFFTGSQKYITGATGAPNKEYNVMLTKNYYSTDCSGPITSIATQPLSSCTSGVNGVTMSMKNSCHNSTHYKMEIYKGGDCSGTATTVYQSLGCEAFNLIIMSKNYECVPKEEEKKTITPLVYLAILGVIPILALVYLYRATLFSSCSGKANDGKVHVEKAADGSHQSILP